MRKYFTTCRISFVGATVHRFHQFAMLLTNIAYILMTYFLWSAIYRSNAGVSSVMGFQSTIVYLAFSSSLYFIFQSWIEYDLSAAMINGNIAVDLVKPYDLQIYWVFRITGFAGIKILTIGIPSFLVLAILLKGNFVFGNILLVIPSVIMSFLISVNIDYITGIIAFYTQSVWGVSIVKETLITLLSGMSVPIAFFPAAFRNIVRHLPFSSIFNTPMSILITKTMPMNEILALLCEQLFWVVAVYLIAKMVYRRCISHTIINGG